MLSKQLGVCGCESVVSVDTVPQKVIDDNNKTSQSNGRPFLRGEAQVSLHRLIDLLAPQLPEAESSEDFSNAVSSQAGGDVSKAILGYRAILSGQPNHSGALFGLGVLDLTTGHIDSGVSLIERAIQQCPNSSENSFLFGRLLSSLGRYDQAICWFLTVLRAKPEDPRAEVSVGESLAALARTEEALYHADRAIAVDPRSGRAWALRGLCLAELGDLDSARNAYENAVEFAPSLASGYLGLADLGALKPSSSPFSTMERHIEAAGDTAELQTAVFHFAMGRVLENSGNYRRSIGHYIKANAIARQHVDYDEKAFVARMNQLRKTFSPEFIARFGAGDDSASPIFITGMPRSGSTLVEQILSSHPDVFGAGEVPDLIRVLRINDVSLDVAPELSTGSVARIGRDYVRQMKRYSPAAKKIVNKSLNNFEFIGLIRLALPNAKIIHIKRDPVDTCVSCFSKYIPVPYLYDLGELGRHYREYDSLMSHWYSVLPAKWILEVHYEELVRDHINQIRRILSFCDLEWHDGCLAFHELKRKVRTASNVQVRTSLYGSAIGRWRDCYDELRPLLDALGPLVCDRDRALKNVGK